MEQLLGLLVFFFICWIIGILIAVVLVRWIFRINRIVQSLEEINQRLAVIIENQPMKDKLNSLMRTSNRLPDEENSRLKDELAYGPK